MIKQTHANAAAAAAAAGGGDAALWVGANVGDMQAPCKWHIHSLEMPTSLPRDGLD